MITNSEFDAHHGNAGFETELSYDPHYIYRDEYKPVIAVHVPDINAHLKMRMCLLLSPNTYADKGDRIASK